MNVAFQSSVNVAFDPFLFFFQSSVNEACKTTIFQSSANVAYDAYFLSELC